jgi:hypothetical protein
MRCELTTPCPGVKRGRKQENHHWWGPVKDRLETLGKFLGGRLAPAS